MSHANVLDGHILSLIQAQEIPEQLELQNKLKERGYDIPQATLSRRLKKLNVAKIAGIYRLVDFNTPNLPLILNIQMTDSALIVLHTYPAHANSLASFIDKKYVNFSTQKQLESGILGTLAGDDTVLLIIKSKEMLPQVMQLLETDFPYLQLPD